MTAPAPICVRHRDGWCALAPGAALDDAALSDATACGHVVVLRQGAERRDPTCPDCRAALQPETEDRT